MTDFQPQVTVGDAAQSIETPSQAIITDAFAPVDVIDKTGRKITIAKMKPSELYQMKRMLGSDDVANEGVFNDAFLVSHCRKISDEPVARPSSQLQVMALLDRLGEDGMLAIAREIASWRGIKTNDDGSLAKN